MSIVPLGRLTKGETHKVNGIVNLFRAEGPDREFAVQTAARLFDVHSGDEGIVNAKRVMNHLIHQQFATTIMNYLMNFYDPSALLVPVYLHWFDLRIEQGPLPRPVVAYALVSPDEAAFHSVWPD